MAEIRFISTSIVQPAACHHGDSTEKTELTPWDLQFLLIGPIQKGLLFLKPTPPQEKQLLAKSKANTLVDHLKTSFSRALEFFPPLAGRLGIIKNDDDGTSSFFIDCNNAGALFAHAVADGVTVGDILEPEHVPPIVHSFFPQNGVFNYEGVSKPLLAAQVTELVDGFFISCDMNHVAGEGSSFWNFFNSWSELSRGFDKISGPPSLERWFPSDIDVPIRIPFCPNQPDDKFIPLVPFQERVFHFRREKIEALKARANAEMSTTGISSLQALLAHIWRSVARCRRIDANHETKYMLLISARQRLRPSLPEGYFGVTVRPEVLTTTAGELRGRGLGWVAQQMNKAIALETNDEVRKFLKCWVESPKMFKGGVVKNKPLITSSSPRFNVYGNDFGWGKPVAVRSGSASKSAGKITIFPGVEEGSIDIEVCLSPEELVALGNDREFMEAVNV